MRSLIKRPAITILLASLWIGWAVWANAPHYYDAHAMEQEIAAVLGQPNVNLQPAEAGFPFAYMRYDYSNANQLTIHDTSLSALLPNVLFAFVGVLGVALFVTRIRRVSILGAVTSCCLIIPAIVMCIRLNGLHPDVISYLYILPLILVLMAIAAESIRERRMQNNAMHPSREVEILENGQSSVATG